MAARKDPAPASSVFMTVSVEGTIRLFSGSIAFRRISAMDPRPSSDSQGGADGLLQY
jgi:hypothetical protein